MFSLGFPVQVFEEVGVDLLDLEQTGTALHTGTRRGNRRGTRWRAGRRVAGETTHGARLFFAGEFEAVIRKWDVTGEAVATGAAEAIAKDKPLAEGEQAARMTDEQFQQATRDIAFRWRQFYRDLRKRGADELAAAARVVQGVEEGCQSLRRIAGEEFGDQERFVGAWRVKVEAFQASYFFCFWTGGGAGPAAPDDALPPAIEV